MKTWIGLACAAMVLGASAMTRAGAETPDGSVATVDGDRAASIDKVFESLLSEYGVQTAGAGVIRNGEMVWTGIYGEESPGEPASADTLFNVASITKTVAAETMLRLAAGGRLDLDESMARYWVDPDVVEDPRHETLTARMALTHVTGFPNWRFFMEEGTLQFVSPPGEAFSYSGEGFEYAMRYAEEKTGVSFDQLVREEVFRPAAMKDARFSVDETAFDRIARSPSGQGEFRGHYCRPNGWCREPGDYSAADDMVTTVRDHAAFLISVMNADGYGADMAEDRDRIQSVRDENPAVDCAAAPAGFCPEQQGYGLGWEVLDYDEFKLVGHGGSDWSEVALAYFYSGSKDGIIVFLNAPQIEAVMAMPEAIAALDPDSPMLSRYLRWRDEATNRKNQEE